MTIFEPLVLQKKVTAIVVDMTAALNGQNVFEDVKKDFTKMMKERNDAICKAGGDLPEMADDGVTYATRQIQRPLYY